MAFQIAHHYSAASGARRIRKSRRMVAQAASAIGLYAYELAAEHYGRAIQALELSDQTGTQDCRHSVLLADSQRLPDNRRKQSLRGTGGGTARTRGHWTVVAKALLLFSEVMRDSAA